MADDRDGERALRPFYVGFAASYLLLVAVAVALDYLLYADGAYFAFALASGHPWELCWRDFPLRLGSFVVTGLPAYLVGQLGGSAGLVSKVYQATFLLLPLVALWLTRRLEPRGGARWQLWLMLAMSTLGLTVFGFPTETIVTLALLFPVMAALAAPIERPSRLAVAILLSTVFVFSHEVAILCAPAMLLALLRSPRRAGGARWQLAILLAWWLACWATWWLVRRHFVPANAVLVPALAQNESAYLSILVFHPPPLLHFGVFTSAVVCWFAWRPRDLTHAAVRLGVLAIAVAGAVYCLPATAPADHYDCRAAIALALPVIALVALCTPAPSPRLGWVALGFLATHLLVAGSEIRGWAKYRARMVTQLARHDTYTSSEWRAFSQRELPSYAQGFHWNWSEPYLSALLMAGRSSGAVIADDENWYTPMTCASARRVLPELAWLRPRRFLRLIEDICDKSASSEAFCDGDLLAGDVDGDGSADLICRERPPGGRLVVAYATAGGIARARTWSSDLAWCQGPRRELHAGDVDGDGRTDLLCHDSESGRQRISAARPDGRFGDPTWQSAASDPWCAGEGAELLVGDFDGDGRADLLCHDRVSGALALRVASMVDGRFGGFVDRWQDPASRWCNEPGDQLRVGDIDGDGADDLLCHQPIDGHKWVSFDNLARPAGAGAPPLGWTDWSAALQWCNSTEDNFWLHDHDGDGAADMMCQNPTGAFFWVTRSSRDRKAPYAAAAKQRFAAGWCYGGGGRDDVGRHLIDVTCVQRGWHPHR